MSRFYDGFFTSHADNNALRERIRQAEQQLVSLSNSHRILQQQNGNLNDIIKKQLEVIRGHRKNNLLLNEKIRRQREQIHEARQETLTTKNKNEELVSSLTQQIHTLQFRHDTLDDQEAAQISHQLFSRLERFVRSNFRDATHLNLMSLESLWQKGLGPFDSIDRLETVHQRRAFIQALLVFCFYENIFSSFFLGVTGSCDDVISMLAERVQMLGPARISEHWRLATSVAVDDLTKDYQEGIYQHVIEQVEWYFSAYSSTTADIRAEQLRELITQCIEFKHRLERQEFRYYFACNQPGSVYDSETMRSITGEQGDGAVILFSLWPSLWRDTATDERQLIAPEQVWVKRDNKGH